MTRANKSWWSLLKRKHTARAQGRRSRPRLQVEWLEGRDLPAPLTWAAGARRGLQHRWHRSGCPGLKADHV
jgi:hypothetical protein